MTALWECGRHEWSRLRAQGSAEDIPSALQALAAATSSDEARDAYWRVDNTAIVQGALYESAVATAACGVVLLQRCNAVARPKLLELLVQIGAGELAPSERGAEGMDLHEQCIGEISKGVGSYLDLLERGTSEERTHCVDLLGLLCRRDDSLRSQVRWYFERLLHEAQDDGCHALIKAWLLEI